MATYCTAADVRAALTPSGLSDDGTTAATLEDWQLLDAIDEAEGIIRSYTQRYSIVVVLHEEDDSDDPNNTAIFTVAPDPIRRWTRDIAAYLAALTFRKSKDLTDEDPIVRRYTMVMALLNDVRAGTNVLDLPPADGLDGQRVEVFNLYEGTLFDPEQFLLGPDQQHVQVFIPGQGYFR